MCRVCFSVVILGIGFLIGTAQKASAADVTGYFQLRFVHSLEEEADKWQIPTWRFKVTEATSKHDSLVLQVESCLKGANMDFHWLDAYWQHRFDANWFGRLGLSRVPFGFDNIQTNSPHRLPLDSPQIISQILPGKRDQGLFFFYAPSHYSALFREMEKKDYAVPDNGVFAFGCYSGSGRDEGWNGSLHFVARTAWPFRFGAKQLGQAGISYFTGKYATSSSTGKRIRIEDRACGGFVFIAPRPWGFLAEGACGTMPGVDAAGETRADDFNGYYLQAMYRLRPHDFLYIRTEQYEGYSKAINTPPRPLNYHRHSFGYRWRANRYIDFNVEFEDIRRKGRDEDRLSGQAIIYF